MSANSAVTVLRSPSSADASSDAVTRTSGAAVSTGLAAGVAETSGAPQSAQNFPSSALSEPHFEHRFDKGLPHSAQNFLPTIPSIPHFEQRIPISPAKAEYRDWAGLLVDAALLVTPATLQR